MVTRVLYKHVCNTDTGFIADQIVLLEDALILEVNWFNIVNLSNIFPIGKDRITINLSEIDKWEQVDVSTRGIF